MLIELQHVDLGFGGPLLLDDASLVVDRGKRICVLGRNGCGKSTLLKLLNGDVAPDDGVRRVFDGLKIGFLPQETHGGGGEQLSGSAHAIVLEAGDGNETAADKVLDRLGVDRDAQFAELSGGMRRRVLLARAMLGNPDLLLLDEPTNHLDPDTIEWLEKYLAKPGLSIVFVSHDRRFMANVADEVLELDRGKLFHGRMGYHRYLEQRQARLEDEARAQARFAKKLSEEEVWIRTGIQARRTRNEGRVRRLQAMREQQRNYRRTQGSARADLNTAASSGKIVLELEGASFAYDGVPVLRNVNLRVMRGDRIGIIGANGSGKTTLLNLMLGNIAPETGIVRMGTKVELAEFDQHRAALDETRTLADNVCDGREFIPTGKGERHIISYLQDFLFTPEQARAPIRRLSGGERARLMLARLFSRPFNLLVMDEPTNDLDIETLELLEEILTDYEGTLLLVSHDRAFLDNVTTSIIHVDGRSNVTEYSGGYAEFIRTRTDRNPAPATPVSGPTTSHQGKRAPKLSYKFKLELETLPRTIEKLETEIAALHRRMSDPSFYADSAESITAANENLARLDRELADCYVRWEQLEQLST